MADEILYLLPERQSVASDAIGSHMATPPTPAPPPVAAFTDDTPETGDANFTALVDNLEYNLTVAQALERIAAARRQVPSDRSMQRYCNEGRLAAQKIRTVFGSEWLINESSLERLIASEPVVIDDVASDAGTDMASLASPRPTQVAEVIADTDVIGVASVAARAPVAPLEGERRTIAEVLIENARLLAQVEGRDAIIQELKEDKSFLREEVREGRRTRDDVKNIAERMLDTLKTMATGRLASPNSSQSETIYATVDPDSRLPWSRG